MVTAMSNFVKNDSGFICANCGKEVLPLKYTSRNHCPYCLHSLHVDVMPGDRKNECKGLLKPINVEVSGKKGYVIVHKCTKCGKICKNISASDDDFDEILKIVKQYSSNF